MWPLSPEHEKLVKELGALVARAGAWRFVRGHVVAANTKDYPDPFGENRAGLSRALARTLWHARLELDVTIEDHRQPAPIDHTRLRKTTLELVQANETSARIAITEIGNDDIAGIFATEVGRMFVAQLAHGGHPLRTTTNASDLPDLATGTLAAVYLGFGVVATNASHYRRAVGEIIGRTAYTEHDFVEIGGLPSEDLAMLLAVQATVRDDVLPALDTLAPRHAEAVARWRRVLDEHEDELIAMLELDLDAIDAEPVPPRPPVPRPVTTDWQWEESDLTKENVGRRVYRYPETKAWTTTPLATVAGFVIALPLVMFAGIIEPLYVLPVAGFVGGLAYGLRKKQLRCTGCGSFLVATDATCKLCGGTITADVKSVYEAREREEALEEAEMDAADAAGDEHA